MFVMEAESVLCEVKNDLLILLRWISCHIWLKQILIVLFLVFYCARKLFGMCTKAQPFCCTPVAAFPSASAGAVARLHHQCQVKVTAPLAMFALSLSLRIKYIFVYKTWPNAPVPLAAVILWLRPVLWWCDMNVHLVLHLLLDHPSYQCVIYTVFSVMFMFAPMKT